MERIMNLAASSSGTVRGISDNAGQCGIPPPRTVFIDSYATAAELVTGLMSDGTHFTCTALPAGGWAFGVANAEPESLDALLVLANRAAIRTASIGAVALVSR